MSLPPVPDSPTRLQTSNKCFRVMHCRKFPLDPNALIFAHHLGTYPSLAEAQRVAQNAFRHTLTDYYRQGYLGRYSEEIDLRYRGLITLYVESLVDGYLIRRERRLSEFHIDVDNVWDTWDDLGHSSDSDDHIRRESEEVLFKDTMERNNNKNAPKPKTVVNLPIDSNASRTIRILQHRVPIQLPVQPTPHLEVERAPLWSQTCTIWIDKRLDRPFRLPEDPRGPYTAKMKFKPGKKVHMAPVVEQPVEEEYVSEP
ncbi:hypothetical protein EJ02DRAFT_436798 [Clathrospora elynae]|uniref:Uncharacterized protein n=1 Tax=Clathrospora elynae TaxID=706981 RepID=A0A6A5SHP4_9PLEO|nr:hypothetical protein EJ02DRAFT_436798 [Clathrospora elynae]